jgi:hypothetical protein
MVTFLQGSTAILKSETSQQAPGLGLAGADLPVCRTRPTSPRVMSSVPPPWSWPPAQLRLAAAGREAGDTKAGSPRRSGAGLGDDEGQEDEDEPDAPPLREQHHQVGEAVQPDEPGDCVVHSTQYTVCTKYV